VFWVVLCLAALTYSLCLALLIDRAYNDAEQSMFVGLCNDVYMTAMEASQFPQGCLWIEPIDNLHNAYVEVSD
jgi:hypothetical protein